MSSSNVHILHSRFHDFATHARPDLDDLPVALRRAAGYLTQIYGLMVGAGLYSDYELGVSATMVHMVMRPRGAGVDGERRWMSLEHEACTRQWIFLYRGLSLSDGNLDRLARKAHRHIETLEKRNLPPLLRSLSAV